MEKALKKLMALAKEQKVAQVKEVKRFEEMEVLFGDLEAGSYKLFAKVESGSPLYDFEMELVAHIDGLYGPEESTDFDVYARDAASALKLLATLGKVKKANAKWVADRKAAEKAAKKQEANGGLRPDEA